MGRSSKRETVSGDLLKQLRAALQVTQGELAELIGVDRVTLARWEGGTPAPVTPILAASLRCLAAGNLPLPAEHPAWHAELFARDAGVADATGPAPSIAQRIADLEVALKAERRRIEDRQAELQELPRPVAGALKARLASASSYLDEALFALTGEEGVRDQAECAGDFEAGYEAGLAAAAGESDRYTLDTLMDAATDAATEARS